MLKAQLGASSVLSLLKYASDLFPNNAFPRRQQGSWECPQACQAFEHHGAYAWRLWGLETTHDSSMTPACFSLFRVGVCPFLTWLEAQDRKELFFLNCISNSSWAWDTQDT